MTPGPREHENNTTISTLVLPRVEKGACAFSEQRGGPFTALSTITSKETAKAAPSTELTIGLYFTSKYGSLAAENECLVT